MDERLRRLYNAVVATCSETVSINTALKAEQEAMILMEELTNELRNIK